MLVTKITPEFISLCNSNINCEMPTLCTYLITHLPSKMTSFFFCCPSTVVLAYLEKEKEMKNARKVYNGKRCVGSITEGEHCLRVYILLNIQ